MAKLLRTAAVLAMILTIWDHSSSGPVEAQQELSAEALVSGDWRLIAWQYALVDSLPNQDLDDREDRTWGVLIADLTNIGLGGSLDITELTFGSENRVADIAQSVRISRDLRYEGLSDSGKLTVPENGTARLAIIVDMPAEAPAATLRLRDQVLSLVSMVQDRVEPDNVPPLQALGWEWLLVAVRL